MVNPAKPADLSLNSASDENRESAKELTRTDEQPGDDNAAEDMPLVEIKSPADVKEGVEDAETGKSTSKKSKAVQEFQCLTKEQLDEFAKNPFWRRLRLIFFILFWLVWLAMLAAVIVIIVVSPKCPPRPPRQFWQKPFYRLSVKSFSPAADDDASAIGSIAGLAKKMDYLRDTLGFNNFILDSLVARDAGSGCTMDFASYNSSLMSLDSLKALTKLGRKKGFSFLMEFDASQADLSWDSSRGAFVTGDSASGALPRLASRDGGSALRDSRLHLPRSACPSLNVSAPQVVERIESALSFWLDAGLSGFVLTNVAFMSPSVDATAVPAGLDGHRWNSGDPTPLLFSNASVDFVRRLRRFVNDQSEKRGLPLALFAEPGNTGYPQPPASLAAYLDPKDGAHAVISSALGTSLSAPLSSATLASNPRQMIADTLEAVGSNGSVVFASAWSYLRRPSEPHLTALSLLLPGVPCLYYGQELAMGHVGGVRFHGNGLSSYLPGNESTDQSETPMQWSDSVANVGWLKNASTPLTWVNLTARAADIRQHNLRLLTSSGQAAPQLQLVKSLVKLINNVESLQWGGIEFLTGRAVDHQVVAFKREAERFPAALVVMNIGDKEAIVELGEFKVKTGTLKVAMNIADGSSSYQLDQDYSLGAMFAPAKSILVFVAKTEEA